MPREATRHNGLAIRCFRIKQGDKPGSFANKAGISYQHLDNLENERKEASLEVLYRVASALDVPVRAILRDESVLNLGERISA